MVSACHWFGLKYVFRKPYFVHVRSRKKTTLFAHLVWKIALQSCLSFAGWAGRGTQESSPGRADADNTVKQGLGRTTNPNQNAWSQAAPKAKVRRGIRNSSQKETPHASFWPLYDKLLTLIAREAQPSINQSWQARVFQAIVYIIFWHLCVSIGSKMDSHTGEYCL